MMLYPINGLSCTYKSILEFDNQVFDRQKNTRSIGGCNAAARPYLMTNSVRFCLANHFLHQVIDNLVRSEVGMHDFQFINPTLN